MHGEGMVKTNLAWEGKTPATVKLRREYEYIVIVALEGYKTTELTLEHGTNGWLWGNLLFGWALGFAIDLTNGAAKKLQPNEINIELVMSANSRGEKTVYALIQALDVNGQPRVISVPLIPKS
jgi:hypothetical protein